MPDITINLQQIILLSQSMLKKAKNESWDDVFVLEKDRRKLLNFFLSTVVKPEHEQEVAVGIESVIAIDKEIMALGQLKKLDLTQMLQTMGQGKKAVKAYTS
jgi:Flagellar protein FliT